MTNSIWIKYDVISETDGIVTEQNFVPNAPINGVSEDRARHGIYIDSIPVEPPINIGQANILHINPTTLELFWVTIDIPKTEIELALERIAYLEKSNAELTTLIATMTTPQM